MKKFSLSLLISLLHQPPATAQSGQPPQRILDSIRSGQSVEVIVEFDDTAVRQQATSMANTAGRRSHGTPEIAYKRTELARIKQVALGGLAGVSTLRDFENLSSSFIRVENEAALWGLLARADVKRVVENYRGGLLTAQSLPLIDQVAVRDAGVIGTGQTIAVLDTGVEYGLGEFGSCSAPGMPSSCRVLVSLDLATEGDDLQRDADPNDHGTNVSGIAAATAPGANLVVLDVFDSDTRAADFLEGLNWVSGNAATYGIGAANMSWYVFGEGTPPALLFNQIECPLSPLSSGLQAVIDAGVQPVAAAGNFAAIISGNYQDGITDPACYPGTVSVGAVYDDDLGEQDWGACVDSTTTSDQIICFSQSAPILDLIAPGSAITAGGVTLSGTSMAAPHVAGAWAVMRVAMPNATHADILAALQAQGTPITDARNLKTTSRIDLFDALDSEGPGGAGDGILFPLDNCSALANANQVNADADACGNRCDGDFDDSGFTSIGDFTTFKTCFVRTVGAPGGPASDPNCLESDMDGSGAMSIGDFTDFKAEFTGGGGLPGPSGLPSAAPGTACTP